MGTNMHLPRSVVAGGLREDRAILPVPIAPQQHDPAATRSGPCGQPGTAGGEPCANGL